MTLRKEMLGKVRSYEQNRDYVLGKNFIGMQSLYNFFRWIPCKNLAFISTQEMLIFIHKKAIGHFLASLKFFDFYESSFLNFFRIIPINTHRFKFLQVSSPSPLTFLALLVRSQNHILSS